MHIKVGNRHVFICMYILCYGVNLSNTHLTIGLSEGHITKKNSFLLKHAFFFALAVFHTSQFKMN